MRGAQNRSSGTLCCSTVIFTAIWGPAGRGSIMFCWLWIGAANPGSWPTLCPNPHLVMLQCQTLFVRPNLGSELFYAIYNGSPTH